MNPSFLYGFIIFLEYLPPLTDLNSKIVQRKPGQFKPDPKRRNMLFDAFYQYFILQFFDADFNLTVSRVLLNKYTAESNVKYFLFNTRTQVTASQLYGADEVTTKELRSFSNGKLKTERLNHEDYPPSLSYTKRIKTIFFPTNSASKSVWVRTNIVLALCVSRA